MVANELMERAMEFMATCHRNLSSTARRLRTMKTGRTLDSRFSSGRYIMPFMTNGMKRSTGCGLRNAFSRNSMKKMIEQEDEEEEGVWKRTILWGEKCQPLEYSGAIYYDCNGRRLATPLRSPLRTLLLSAPEKEGEGLSGIK